MKENLIKAIIIFGGGYLVFSLFKPKKEKIAAEANKKTVSDSTNPPADIKNAEIVASAYAQALKAGETAQRLTELNKELMKEFGMRCFVSESNQLKVVDAKGNTILTK
jgi:hypothetical protein